MAWAAVQAATSRGDLEQALAGGVEVEGAGGLAHGGGLAALPPHRQMGRGTMRSMVEG